MINNQMLNVSPQTGEGNNGSQEKPTYMIINEFSTILNTLTHNDANIIKNLTQFSFINIKAAKEIVSLVEQKIHESTNSRQKLTIIYLLDSIIKNVGRGYVELFSQNIVNTFVSSFKSVDDQIKASLLNLYKLWKDRSMVKQNYLDDISKDLEVEFNRVSHIQRPSSQSMSRPNQPQPINGPKNNMINSNNMNNMNMNNMNMNMGYNNNNMNMNKQYLNNTNYNNTNMNGMMPNNINYSMDPRFNKGSAPNYGNMNMNYNNMNIPGNMNMNNINQMNNMGYNNNNNQPNNNVNFNRNFNGNNSNFNYSNMNMNMNMGMNNMNMNSNFNFNSNTLNSPIMNHNNNINNNNMINYNNNNMNNFNNNMNFNMNNNNNMNFNSMNIYQNQDQNGLVSMVEKMTVYLNTNKDPMAIQEVKSFVDDSKMALYQQPYNQQHYFMLKQRFLALQSKYTETNTNNSPTSVSNGNGGGDDHQQPQSLSPTNNSNESPTRAITSPPQSTPTTTLDNNHNNSTTTVTTTIGQGKALSIDSSDTSVDNKKGEYDLYEALYLNYPLHCSSCGLRFKESGKMDKHMDWHWKLNKQQKKRPKQSMSRSWFIEPETWVHYVPDYTQNISEHPSVPFFNDNKSKKEESKPLPNLIADDSQPSCYVCREKFDRFWDEEAEEWMYKAVEIHSKTNKIIHANCNISNNNNNISPNLTSHPTKSSPNTTSSSTNDNIIDTPSSLSTTPKKERSHDSVEQEIQDQQPTKKKLKSEENPNHINEYSSDNINEHVDLKTFKEKITSNNIL